jgi:integrase/recombinase XerD
MQRGYRSLSSADADYLNLSAKDNRIARASRERPVPTLDQIRHALACAPAVERRDRALIAFTLLTGARDGATASLKLKHLDLVAKTLNQDAREVSTKGAKSFTTWFFPVGDDVEHLVIDWVRFLIKEKRFGSDDPLFPATKVRLVERRFAAIGVSRSHWSNTTPIRNAFKRAFARAPLLQSSFVSHHSGRARSAAVSKSRRV